MHKEKQQSELVKADDLDVAESVKDRKFKGKQKYEAAGGALQKTRTWKLAKCDSARPPKDETKIAETMGVQFISTVVLALEQTKHQCPVKSPKNRRCLRRAKPDTGTCHSKASSLNMARQICTKSKRLLVREAMVLWLQQLIITQRKVAIKKINDIFEHVSEATRILREIKLLRTCFPPRFKPKNILANADCKLKICDFGLARASFSDAPSAVFWTDYVATRWYRAPELCGSFFSKCLYSSSSQANAKDIIPAIDIWSIGCIFAEMLTGEPLFPGKMWLLECLIAFDPKDRPSAEEALADPYFYGLANVEDEPSTQPISKIEFEFERRTLTKDDVRELIYREILEYHPQMLQEYLRGVDQILHVSKGKVDRTPFLRRYASLPRERVCSPIDEDPDQNSKSKNQTMLAIRHPCLPSPKKSRDIKGSELTNTSAKARQGGCTLASHNARCLPRSASISASTCVGIEGAYYCEVSISIIWTSVVAITA
ncbi:Mitogen-activated protein kinase [Sesamum angolense]|uniref:Mitogen-activated protein kinase n=1 Tax=Sesamum angolense TaxID=2727404 RepID=A0AAE1WVL2_9LAMI|nr:Mitogen-activated protein kinase [Sesamum angolense]